MRGLGVRLYLEDGTAEERSCISLVLEREIYTPYSQVTAVCLPQGLRTEQIRSLGILWGEEQIFFGLLDHAEQYAAGGAHFLKVRGRSFGALLVQNELEKGLHSNLTIQSLLQGFYRFPHLTCQEDSRTGYVYATELTSLWDCILNFGYKLNQMPPYAAENEIRLTLPADPVHHEIREAVQYGITANTTKLISHIHMEDLSGNPNAYQAEDQAATAAQIVRHKQVGFDRHYLSDPQKAVEFRSRFARRACRAKYVEYAGFANEMLGDRLSFPGLIDRETICRVRLTVTEGVWRTKLWVYEDGFYN